MRNKRQHHSWYFESLRKHKREKIFFYLLVFIAVIMFAFAVYVSRGS